MKYSDSNYRILKMTREKKVQMFFLNKRTLKYFKIKEIEILTL